eukprot:1121014-Prymnesium_polylepis.1
MQVRRRQQRRSKGGERRTRPALCDGRCAVAARRVRGGRHRGAVVATRYNKVLRCGRGRGRV